MGDVLDAKSCRLGRDTLNSIQRIKSHLSKRGSVAYIDRKDSIAPGLTNCMINAGMEKKRKLIRKETDGNKERKAGNCKAF